MKYYLKPQSSQQCHAFVTNINPRLGKRTTTHKTMQVYTNIATIEFLLWFQQDNSFAFSVVIIYTASCVSLVVNVEQQSYYTKSMNKQTLSHLAITH